MPYEKAPSSGAFLPLSLMHILSGEPMHDLSGVDEIGRSMQNVPLQIYSAKPLFCVVFFRQRRSPTDAKRR